MNTSFLVIDFIIAVAAACLGFIAGAMFVQSAAEKDIEYLAAEVENLNEALDALTDSYEQLVRDYEISQNALNRSNDRNYKAEKLLQGRIRDRG